MAGRETDVLSDLDAHARRLERTLSRAVHIRANETELREDANGAIASSLHQLFGIEDSRLTAERPSSRQARRTYDKVFGGVVMEWEWRMDAARRRDGARQAVGYLCDLRSDSGDESAFTAVVCDGATWGFLAVDPCGQMDLLGRLPSDPSRLFEWHPNSAGACRRFLELVGSHRSTPITSSGLVAAFGPGSPEAAALLTLLAEVLAARALDDRVDTLYREWRRVLDVAYGDLDAVTSQLATVVERSFDLPTMESVGEVIFVLHTYFAMVARLLAVEVLAIAANDPSARPTHWPPLSDDQLIGQLEALDQGRLPAGLDVQNLLEADVFSWYSDTCRGNVDLLSAIRSLLARLSEFAFPRVAFGANPTLDILRDLYQALVPRPLRRALGEFLTPAWLAEACLARLSSAGVDLDRARVLDPTCGTGTFLVPVLRQRVQELRAERGSSVTSEEVQEVLESTVGFDINPVAVIAARVNYLLALGDLATLGPISLPVWRTDSILVPDAPARQGTLEDGRLAGRKWREVMTSLPFSFPIPDFLASGARMAHLRRLLEDAMLEDDEAQSRDAFLLGLEMQFGLRGRDPAGDDEWPDVATVAIELHDRLRGLADQGRNGIWAQIIENSFAPIFLGPVDVVVGNPPWLTWTRLPEDWRRKAEPVWRRYGLWRIPKERGDRNRSLASTDLAVLVFATAMDRYLRHGGTLGLLTPDSLLTADPGGRAFRRFHLVEDEAHVDAANRVDIPFRIVHVDDWSRVSPFQPEASNRPVFIVARRDKNQVFPVPQSRWQRAKSGLRLGDRWLEVRSQLKERRGEANPVDRAVETSAWSWQGEDEPQIIAGGENEWPFGKGLDTRGANGIFFVQVEQVDRARNRVLITNVPEAGRNRNVVRATGWVEAELVRPLLRGRDVQAWTASPSTHIFLPYDPRGIGRLLGNSRFRSEFPEGWRWLRRNKASLITRRPPPTRSWDMESDDWCRLDGPLNHMAGAHIVVVREQQRRPAAAILEPHFDRRLGRTVTPVVDHKLTFCAVDARAEAIYLASFINSSPLQDLLASYGNQIAISPQTLRRLPIPAYTETNSAEAIVAVGEAFLAGSGDQEALDRLVLDAIADRSEPALPGIATVTLEMAEPYKTHVPMLSLEAAAGPLLQNPEVEPIGWVRVEGMHLHEGLFAVTVRGKSMESRIADGAVVLFRGPRPNDPLDPDDGAIVLAELHAAEDPEHGGRYTVKRLRRQQSYFDGAPSTDKVILESLNPEVDDIELVENVDDQFRVVGEFLRVLGLPS